MELFHQTDSLGSQGIDTYPPYKDTIPPLIWEAASHLKGAGGFLYLVGGCVRDLLWGKIPSDWDCEVFGLSEKALNLELKEFCWKKWGGVRVKKVGKDFPVWKLKEMDIALPRRERKVSVGHTGFDVSVDPFMSLGDAAQRRDLTINAVYLDPLTGAIHDPLGGRKDLLSHLARPVSPRFKEDPLRVMRAAQFCSRFSLLPTQALIGYSIELQEEFDSLPVERIHTEWDKLLQQGAHPSYGLLFLQKCGWSRFFWRGQVSYQPPNSFHTFRDHLAILYGSTNWINVPSITGRTSDQKFLAALQSAYSALEVGEYDCKFATALRLCSKNIDNVSLLKCWAIAREQNITPWLEMLHEEKIWRSFHPPKANGTVLMGMGFKGPAIKVELERLYLEQMEALDDVSM